MKVYLSGKISGLDYSIVESLFGEAEAKIKDLGLTPVSPLNNGLHRSATWAEHMTRDIEMLFGCEAIYLLPNWESSKGARIEKYIAEEMGLLIISDDSLIVSVVDEAITESVLV